MKTHKIFGALILLLFASGAIAKAAPGPKNKALMVFAEQIANANKIQATSCDNHQESITSEKLLTTRKKLVYYLEMDPMRTKPKFDYSGGKPSLNLC